MAVLSLPLHRNQLTVYRQHRQLSTLVCGRGWGKTTFGFIKAVVRCLSYKGEINQINPQVVVIGMPLLNQARNAYWETVLNVLEGQSYIKQVDRTNFRVKFKGRNKPDLLIKGADDGANKWRSLNILSAVLDEYQDFGPDSWAKVIYPALSRNKDWDATIIGTPKGKNNILYHIFEQAQQNRNWTAHQFTTKDNPLYPLESLREAKRRLPPKVYDQEYKASFINFDAQYYPSLSAERHLVQLSVHEVLRITSTAERVFVGVDWGDRNSAAVVIAFSKDKGYWLVDAWQPQEGAIVTEKEFTDVVAGLCKKYNVYRVMCPDDRTAMHRAFQVAGVRQKINGLARADLVNRNQPGVSESNLIVDSMFHQDRLFINQTPPSCAALQGTQLGDDFISYHKEKIKGTDIVVDKPAPNQRDHLISACRYVVARLEHKHHPLAKQQLVNQAQLEVTLDNIRIANVA